VDRIPALVAQWKPFHLPIRDDALRTVPAAIRKELHNDPDLIFGRYIWDPWPIEAVPRRKPPQLEERRRKQTTEIPPGARVLTVAQAAVYIGRSEPALRNLMYRHKIPTIRNDGHPALDIRDLEKWIDAGRES
jgi:hypothetical protein